MKPTEDYAIITKVSGETVTLTKNGESMEVDMTKGYQIIDISKLGVTNES